MQPLPRMQRAGPAAPISADMETLPTAQELWSFAWVTPEQPGPDSAVRCCGQLPPRAFRYYSFVDSGVSKKVWQLPRKGSGSEPAGTRRTICFGITRMGVHPSPSWNGLREALTMVTAPWLVARRLARASGQMCYCLCFFQIPQIECI